MGSLNFSELSHANVARLKEFPGHHDDWNLAEWGNAIAGETGELCNVLKKIARRAPNDPPTEDLRRMAGKELGDVITYADLIAHKLGLDLGEEVRAKFNEVSSRHGLAQTL